MKIKNIQTNNREIYEKFSMLNLVSEVVLPKNGTNINKIIKNINRETDLVESKILGNGMFLIRKKQPIRFNVFLRENK